MPKLAAPLDASGIKLINLGTPTASGDAVNMSYCDSNKSTPAMVYISGRVYTQSSISASPKQCPVGTLFLCPIYVPKAITITGYAFDITTAATSGTAQVALYSSNTNGLPSALVANSTASGISTGATGNVTGTLGTPLTLAAGLYWTGLISATVAPYVMAHVTGLIPASSVGAGSANGNDFFQMTSTTFPTTVAPTDSYQYAPRVGVVLQ